ncbi:hypothetical protein PF003_g34504 [Phytophthora fragariae]|nr:hypothetical protein PF003_g34504 [Phytophthora fragariae]
MKLLASSVDTGKIAAPPVAIVCLACHGQYFAASLPIHQKTCFQRNPDVLVPCEKCNSCVRASGFHSHGASCSGKPVSSESNGFKQHSDLFQRAPMDLNLPEADGRPAP